MANGLSLDPIAKNKLLLSDSKFYLQIYFRMLRYIYIYIYVKVVKDLEVYFITVLKFLFIIFLGKKKKPSHSLA